MKAVIIVDNLVLSSAAAVDAPQLMHRSVESAGSSTRDIAIG